MFIHVYNRNRARPNSIFEAGEPAQKIILLSKVKYFPNNYSKKKYSLFNTHHIMNNFLAAVVLSTRHFASTTTPPLYAYNSPLLRSF